MRGSSQLALRCQALHGVSEGGRPGVAASEYAMTCVVVSYVHGVPDQGVQR